MTTYYVLASEIEITSANNVIKFKEDAGTTRTATIATGTYYLYGPGSEAGDLCKAIADAMTTAPDADADYVVEYRGVITAGSVTGQVTIRDVGDGFDIQIIASGTTFPLVLIGFPVADSIAETVIASTLSPSHTWCSDQPPELVDPDGFEVEVAQHVAGGGQRHTFTSSSVREMRRLAFSFVTKDRAYAANATADPARAFESFWKIVNDGRRIRLYGDTQSGGTVAALSSADLLGTYVFDEESCRRWRAERPSIGVPLYDWSLGLAVYV